MDNKAAGELSERVGKQLPQIEAGEVVPRTSTIIATASQLPSRNQRPQRASQVSASEQFEEDMKY